MISRRIFAFVSATVVVVATGGAPAFADAPTAAGWWTVTGASTPVAVGAGGPDVPTGGLVVESGGSAATPVAIAALSYQTAPAAGASATLTLAVAPNSATTPSSSLEVCPLTGPATFKPADGGSMSDAPKYDCAHHVTAAVSSGGDSFSFDLSSLLDGSPVAVAVLPAADVERVVLAKPDQNSLTTGSASPAPVSNWTPTDSSSSSGSSTSSGGAPVAASGPGTPAAVDPSSAVGSPAAASTAADPTAMAAADPTGSVTAAPSAGATPSMAAAPSASGGAPATGSGSPASGANRASGSTVAIGATAGSGHAGSPAPLVALLAVAGVVLAGLLWGYAGAASRAGALTDPSGDSEVRTG